MCVLLYPVYFMAFLTTHEFTLPPSATLSTPCGPLVIYLLFLRHQHSCLVLCTHLHITFSPSLAGESFYNFLGAFYSALCLFPHPRRPSAVFPSFLVPYMLLSACMPISAFQHFFLSDPTSVFANGFF
jgi:hypothetical protein